MINKHESAHSISIDFDSFRASSKGDLFTDMIHDKNYTLNYRGKLNLNIAGETALLLIGYLTGQRSTIPSSIEWFFIFTFIGILYISTECSKWRKESKVGKNWQKKRRKNG